MLFRSEQFFAWVHQQFEAQGLLPNNPLTKALAYARERRLGLEVTLNDPEVPIDTNHLERALRASPMGRNSAKSVFMRSRGRAWAALPWAAEVHASETASHSYSPRRNSSSALGGR